MSYWTKACKKRLNITSEEALTFDHSTHCSIITANDLYCRPGNYSWMLYFARSHPIEFLQIFFSPVDPLVLENECFADKIHSKISKGCFYGETALKTSLV